MARADLSEAGDVIDADFLPQALSLIDSSSADGQDLRLGFLIHDVSRLRRNAFDQLMRPLGVTRSQWWVIAHLSRHDGMMQTDLATLLDIGKVTLGGLVDRLEAGGWVQRQPDAHDRRVKRVFLTPTAQGLIRDMRNAEQRHNRNVLKGFSRDERNQLTDMLSRIKKNLGEVVHRKREKASAKSKACR